MTANAMMGDKERCLAAGMDAYVSKPIQIRELLAVIETYAHDVTPASTLIPPPTTTPVCSDISARVLPASSAASAS